MKNENIYPIQNMYTSIQSSFICYSQDVEIIQMGISWWMQKQTTVYPNNAIWLINRKKLNTDPC